jgi:hypothetical protein
MLCIYRSMAFQCRVRSLQKAKATAETLLNIILGLLTFPRGFGFRMLRTRHWNAILRFSLWLHAVIAFATINFTGKYSFV